MTAPSVPSSVPARLPAGFEFVRLLGRGGNGYVVCARQLDLDRLVAVKMIFGGALAAGGLSRLQREGRALARLNHPNVIRVFAAVPMADDLALVLEFVEGETLESVLAARRLGTAETFAVLDDVAAAVAHCAGKGIVHRDLKPANILLTANGRAKVADFGLARLSRTAAAFRTSSGVASGTPRYMAPEQIHDPDREDPSLDAYSFGVMAFRALYGEFPYRKGDSEAARALDASIHAAARQAFNAVLGDDPAARLSPLDLLARLRILPTDSWRYAARAESADLPGVARGRADTAAEADPETRLDAAGQPSASGVIDQSRPVIVATEVGNSTPSWVDVPVFSPGRRKRSFADSPRLAGALFGVLLVVVVVTLLAGR